MPDQPQAQLSELHEYRHWKPEAQAKALELLEHASTNIWHPFYCPNPVCGGRPHILAADNRDCEAPNGHDWALTKTWECTECHVGGTALDEWVWEHARVDQRPPKWSDEWLTWVLRGGRGSGKTRTGSEVTHRVTKVVRRITLIAPTGPDFRETMVEGDSGILATSPPGKKPLWEPSKKKLTWPNGCIGLGFSAEEPDRLRGPQHGFIWADEPAHYPLVDLVWDNMLFGLRQKNLKPPKVVATSTPKPTKWMKALLADPYTIDHRVSTYANLQNLASTFKRIILNKYEGTRQGKQELHGEVIEDVEGSLWKYAMFQWLDLPEDFEFVRIVVGVDPAGTANKKSDETGIVVCGIDAFHNIYVLDDQTGKYSPGEWARKANAAYDKWSADAIVAEKNYGGDMVKHTLENTGYRGAHVIDVTSRRGKAIRAEPIVALYEKSKVFHVGAPDSPELNARGALMSLEDEQTSWVPGEGDSPNRVDALVHAVTELAKLTMPSEVADPTKFRAAGNSREIPGMWGTPTAWS